MGRRLGPDWCRSPYESPGHNLPPANARTVFVVDDDPAALHSLCTVLRLNGFDARGYGSAAAFLADVAPRPGACLITDLSMPEMDGVALIGALRERGLTMPSIVLTGRADIASAVEAMKAGATDLIEKPYDVDHVVQLATQALDRELADDDLRALTAAVRRRMARLSQRELEVLAEVVAGASNKEIARTLDISPRTVEVYRAAVMRKMEACSLAELVRQWLLAEGAAAATA